MRCKRRERRQNESKDSNDEAAKKRCLLSLYTYGLGVMKSCRAEFGSFKNAVLQRVSRPGCQFRAHGLGSFGLGVQAGFLRLGDSCGRGNPDWPAAFSLAIRIQAKLPSLVQVAIRGQKRIRRSYQSLDSRRLGPAFRGFPAAPPPLGQLLTRLDAGDWQAVGLREGGFFLGPSTGALFVVTVLLGQAQGA